MDEALLHIEINKGLFAKDPNSSKLGQKIISQSIEMIDDLGFECFTFRKLGVKIGSNESSIYRYFESKHALLVYLVNWYWSWMEYRLLQNTAHLETPTLQLNKAIELLTEAVEQDNSFSFINEKKLYEIIVKESSKAYYTKDIDKENAKGYYKTYMRVVNLVSGFVLFIKPDFEFPQMLVSTIIEGAQHQRYFSKHLPSLTNFKEGGNNITRFYKQMANEILMQPEH